MGFPRQKYCSGLPFPPPQRSEAICILFDISDTYTCRCMPILHIQIYHPVAEIETRCPGWGHTDGSWQSWDSTAAQTPEWTRAGDIVPLVIGSSCFSLKSLTAAHGPAEGHRWGSLDTQCKAEDSGISGWSILLIRVEGLWDKFKEENNWVAVPRWLPLAETEIDARGRGSGEEGARLLGFTYWFLH